MSSFDIASALGIGELPTYLDRVDQAMKHVLTDTAPSLHRPIQRLLSSSGKRLRSSLVIACAASQGATINDQVIKACVAIELVHIGSLVHDDIIDKASKRWNIETVNAREGTNTAILVGDYLFAHACLQAATISAETGQVVAATIARLCDGESREVADRFNLGRSLEDLERAISGKTAALISAACQVGGLAAGLEASDITAFENFGHEFGMAFQLIDDVLDLLSSPQLMGKPTGNDIVEGVYTMPILLSLRSPKAGQLKALLEKKTTAANRAAIIKLLFEDDSITKTLQAARKHNLSAAGALSRLTGNDTLNNLKALPPAYLHWALTNLIAPPYQASVAQFLV